MIITKNGNDLNDDRPIIFVISNKLISTDLEIC